MSVPTPYMFMKRFLKAALSDKKVNHSLMMVFIELEVLGGKKFTIKIIDV
jgi:hypothetical protein